MEGGARSSAPASRAPPLASLVPAKLGQHFLADASAARRIVEAADLASGDTVVEIGPGRGALTTELLSRGCRVVAIEMDRALASLLRDQFAGVDRIEIHEADFLRFDIEPYKDASPKFIGNLPYAAASPILQKILSWPSWRLAVFMFQKEVADRLTARPGGADYGVLTLSRWIRADAEALLTLGPESFRPRPRIRSTVLRFRRLDTPRLAPQDEKLFFRAAKAAFQERRKMAAGAMARLLDLPRSRVEAAFLKLGLDPRCRAQEIPPEAYLRLPSELGLSRRET